MIGILSILKGGAGSGFYDHDSIPGHLGGSAPRNAGGSVDKPTNSTFSAMKEEEKNEIVDSVVRNLTKEEIENVQIYTTNAAIDLNLLLRLDPEKVESDPMIKKIRVSLDKAFDNAQGLSTNTIVYRSVDDLEFIPDVGKEFVDKGFVSTSLSLQAHLNTVEYNEDWNAVPLHTLEIKVPKGKKLLPLRGRTGGNEEMQKLEDEGLLERGTKFIVESKDVEELRPDRTRIVLRVVK